MYASHSSLLVQALNDLEGACIRFERVKQLIGNIYSLNSGVNLRSRNDSREIVCLFDFLKRGL